ncbi:MAG: Fic family protein [Solirubrobacterales bacterium]|nr:Fic family protein [Solirubrobacterales bacterium]
MQVYLAKGFLATTAIEGNTLSEQEARGVLEGTISLPPSREYLGREIENVIDAYNHAKDELEVDPALPFSVNRLKEQNRRILDGLDLEDGVVPGEVRAHSLVVGPYRAVPEEDAEYLLGRLCEWLNSDEFSQPAGPELAAPLAIVKAVIAHLYLAWIHPFGDGNGRTARLLELQILLTAGFPAPSCQLLSNHYNQTRSEYYRQLDQSSRGQTELGFLTYAVRGFVDQLREQLDRIDLQQFEDRWEQFVYQTFGGLRGESDTRKLHLVLDLSSAHREAEEPIERAALTTLTPRLAQAYATKTEKTLTRDLNAIEKLGLLRRKGSGWVPADEQILGLRPGGSGVLWQY